MKIAVVSTFVPFIYGGGRNIVDWLAIKLAERGHEVEKVLIPQVDTPELLFSQMEAIRNINLDSADLVICIRPQAHVIRHRNKVVWFIHHIRLFYDLWDSEYRTFPDSTENLRIKSALRSEDTLALRGAKKVFTNSEVVSERLMRFNQISSTVLYPPILDASGLSSKSRSNQIVYISRVEHHKRQHLFIEAMKYVKSPAELRICGVSHSVSYAKELELMIEKFNLGHSVHFENCWVSESKKHETISNSLALVYAPLDEDSYGYPTIEGSHAEKPILTTTDSGGVLELVRHNFNGLIVEPEPRKIAEAIDFFYFNADKTEEMGKNAAKRLVELKIDWDHVISELTS